MRWSRWAVLIAGFLVAGCTSQVGGTALPDPGYTPPKRTLSSAAELIGNAGALDPCSLLDPAALAQFGAAEKPAQEAYDYCWLKLPVGSATVAVRFGLLERIRGELQAKEIEPVGTLRVFEENPVKDRCARYIMFSDNVTMAVSADTYDTPGANVPQLCSIAEKATTTVAENVAARRMKHVDYPPASLARMDACKAVTVSLPQVPGLPAGEVISYPGGHQCRWGQAMVPSLTLRFVLDEPSTAPEVKVESIAGLQTSVYSAEINGRTLCVAEAKHGTGRELAQVIVRLPPNNAEPACAAARSVAAEAWRKLPS
ncbi:DUF3558 domain-containing protein [Kibdelosporangium aridum]|uniref:DUF3558 domain-containing protein n=1 Tax=Kibdelosporangium aridum TaxID=2030 RepID=A0A428Z6I9_KIBAR|nr:DUF3558 family protein [Kibdelosporangium aridum]RSM82809.1 DUF3558 domain-containing protein [Kibdelosporangium aridum]